MAFIMACGMLASTVIGAFVGYYVGDHTPGAACIGALFGGCFTVPVLFMVGVAIMLTMGSIEARKENK